MKMKLYILMFIFVFTAISCSKYEDGPFISLRSKKDRLFGKWEVVEFIKDNEDLTQFYVDTCGCTFAIGYDAVRTQGVEENYVFIYCPLNLWNFYNDSVRFDSFFLGSWNFSSDKKQILLSFGYNSSSSYRWGMYPLTICQYCKSLFEILRLTNKELWLRYDDTQNIYTIKFEKL
jgi:hypothetical protein